MGKDDTSQLVEVESEVVSGEVLNDLVKIETIDPEETPSEGK